MLGTGVTLVKVCYTDAMMEIEVKAKVSNIKYLLGKADQLGISFGEPCTQDDITYETETPKDDPDWNIFRIRRQADQAILTMKYKASSSSRDNHERESIIENPEEVADMLERVGYKLGVRIVKTRRTAKYKELEICLDEVKELGTFIEVEKLTDEKADVDTVQTELWNVLLELGVKPKDRVHEGYDMLMHALLETSK
jgi:adenylate cyclase class 2